MKKPIEKNGPPQYNDVSYPFQLQVIMFHAAISSFKDVIIATPASNFEITSVIDHPSAWVELLDVTPAVDSDGFCMSANMYKPDRFSASPCELGEVVVGANNMSAYRKFELMLADAARAYCTSLRLAVDASADQVVIKLEVFGMDSAVLASEHVSAGASVALAVIMMDALNAAASMHAQLSSDLADTTIKVQLIGPDLRYQTILNNANVQLNTLLAEAGLTTPCLKGVFGEVHYADALAAAAVQGFKRTSLTVAQRLALAVNLVKMREDKGMTQLEVACEALGFFKSHAAVSRLERGILTEVEQERLEKLAAFYGTTVDAMLDNNATSSEPNTKEEEATLAPSVFDRSGDLAPSALFGNRITLARTSAGMSQKALAKALNHGNEATVQLWEEEKATPRRTSFIDLSIALDVPVSWLMYGRRVATPTRGLALRLTAMQKLYSLTNGEVASLMDTNASDDQVLSETKFVARLTIGRQGAARPKLEKLARVFQVPVEWLSPEIEPVCEMRDFNLTAESSLRTAKPVDAQAELLASKMKKFSRKGRRLVSDLIDLLEMGVIEEGDLGELRNNLINQYTSPYITTAKMASRHSTDAETHALS